MAQANTSSAHEPTPSQPLGNCTDCEQPLTPHDVSLNSDDAIELTDGRSCGTCLKRALGYATEFLVPNNQRPEYE